MTVKKKPVGLALLPEDHARLREWAHNRNRTMANAAAFIVQQRVRADELAGQEDGAGQQPGQDQGADE